MHLRCAKFCIASLGEDSDSGIIYYGTKFTPVDEPEEEEDESADSVEAEL